MLGKLRNAMNFSCVGAWPNQQNVLLISKVHLMSKTLFVNSSFSHPEWPALCLVGSAVAQKTVTESWQPWEQLCGSSTECRESSVQRARAQPTKLICLLGSFCRHHHALDSWKGVLAEVNKQWDVEMWIIPTSCFFFFFFFFVIFLTLRTHLVLFRYSAEFFSCYLIYVTSFQSHLFKENSKSPCFILA